LNEYVDEYWTRTIPEDFHDLRNSAYDALRAEGGINSILDNIITTLRNRDVDPNKRRQIYQIGLRAPHLQFENQTLGGIIGRLRGSIDNLNIFKKWLKKIFKAINIVIDSLKAIFPQLDVVKEFKEHLENLSDKTDSNSSLNEPTTY
jgi:hypothetical protein